MTPAKLPLTIICAATQFPEKLLPSIENMLGTAGYSQATSEYDWKLDLVVHHSDKIKTEKGSDDEPARETVIKIFAHYVTVSVYPIRRGQEAVEEQPEAVQR